MTLIKREPEWDDAERESMLALAAYEAGICECGFHSSLTNDTDNHFEFVDRLCNVCRGRAQAARIQAEVDDKIMKSFGEKPPPEKVRPDDGRRTYTKMLAEAEVAEKLAKKVSGSAASERPRS